MMKPFYGQLDDKNRRTLERHYKKMNPNRKNVPFAEILNVLMAREVAAICPRKS